MITQERIEEQINQLEAELVAFVEQANRQIAAQQGGIQALRLLLEPEQAAEIVAAPDVPDDAELIHDLKEAERLAR